MDSLPEDSNAIQGLDLSSLGSPSGGTFEATPQQAAFPQSVGGEFFKGIGEGTAQAGNDLNLGVKNLGQSIKQSLGLQGQELTEAHKDVNFKSFMDRNAQIAQHYPTDPNSTGMQKAARLIGGAVPSIGGGIITGLGATVASGGNPVVGEAAGFGAFTALNSSHEYGEFLQNPKIQDPGHWAVGIGALESGLQMAPFIGSFDQAFGKIGMQSLTAETLAKAGLKESAAVVASGIPKLALQTGLSTAAVQGISDQAKNLLSGAPTDFFSKDSLRNMAISGLGGALIGSVAHVGIGTAGELLGHRQPSLAPMDMSPDEALKRLKDDMQNNPLRPDQQTDPKAPDPTLGGLPKDATDVAETPEGGKQILDAAGLPTDGLKAHEMPHVANHAIRHVLRDSIKPKGTEGSVASRLRRSSALGSIDHMMHNPEITFKNKDLEDVKTKEDLTTLGHSINKKFNEAPKGSKGISVSKEPNPLEKTSRYKTLIDPEFKLKKNVIRTTPEGKLEAFSQHKETGKQEWSSAKSSEHSKVTFDSQTEAEHFVKEQQEKEAEQSSSSDTRGKGTQYHGTSYKIDGLSENIYDKSSEMNIYGPGFYTTDAKDIAKGYSKKGKGGNPSLYTIREKAPVKFFDMEKPLDTDTLNKLKGLSQHDDLLGTAMESFEDRKFSMRDLFDEMRESSSYEGVPAWEVQEKFDIINDILREKGYGGIQHLGGKFTGKKEHLVKIYLDPHKQIELKEERTLRPREGEQTPYNDPIHESTHPVLEEARNGTLKGVSFKPGEVPEEHQNVIDAVSKSIRAVTGENPSLHFLKSMAFKGYEDSRYKQLHGAQLQNGIYVSYGIHDALGKGPKGVLQTGLHEAWHWLYDQRMGLFNESDRKTLESSVPLMAKALVDSHGMRSYDVLPWLDSPTGRAEITAELFGRWAVDKINTRVPFSVKSVFQKAINFLKGIHNGLKGQGFQTYQDVFKRTLEGKMAPQEYLYDQNTAQRVARLSAISDDIAAAARESIAGTDFKAPFQSALEDRLKASWPLHQTAYARSISTATGLAHMDAVFGHVQALQLRQEADKGRMLSTMLDVGKGFYKDENGKATAIKDRVEAMELLDHLRNTEQPLTLSSEGKLTYKKNLVPVEASAKLTRMVKSLDDKNKSVLNGYEKLFRTSMKEYIKDYDTIQPKELKEFIDKQNTLDPTDSNRFEKFTRTHLQEVHDSLVNLGKLKHFGYMPHNRFGPYAITVHAKSSYLPDGKTLKGDAIPLYHGQMDEGHKYGVIPTGKPDAFQLNHTMSELKDLGLLDRNDVVMSPVYTMTHANIARHIPDNYHTLDMLGTLLGNIKDPDEFAAMMSKYEAKVATKGFLKNFTKSDNVPGYSKDWSRVDTSFNGGHSSHIARMQNRPILDYYEGEIRAKLNPLIYEQAWRQRQALNYIKSLKDPHDEFNKLATFNAIWSLGGNITTALLQFAGLPQFTLGHMSQYNPNVFENSSRLTKGFITAWKVFEKGGVSVDKGGIFTAHFDDPEVLKALGGSEAERAYLSNAYKEGILGSLRKEEQFSQSRGEQRSEMGQRMNLWTAFKNFSMLPMTAAETITRATTASSYYRMFEEKPEVLARAVRILENDKQFQAMKSLNRDKPLIDLVVDHSIHETQGIYGRTGRGAMYRNEGRLVFPFMQYTMSMNEMMARMYNRGPEGKKALAVTLGMTMMMAGMLGLPGADLIKGAIEQFYKVTKLQSIDLEQQFRQSMTEMTGSPTAGLFLTHGAPRLTGLDLGTRLNDQIAGQDILLTAMGAKEPGGSDLGVTGGIAANLFKAIDTWRNGGTPTQGLAMLSPTALSNYFKAIEMVNQGAHTQTGTQLLTPDYVQDHPEIPALRALGFNSNAQASAAEQQHWKSNVNYANAPQMDSFKLQGARIMTRLLRGDDPSAEADFEDFSQRVSSFMEDKMLPSSAYKVLMQDISNDAFQRLQGGVPLKEYKKNTVNQAEIIKQASGSPQ